MSTAVERGAGKCLTCEAELTGNYCAACGEKRVGPHDLQLSHLAHDFWHEFTHLDGRIWRSFRALLLSPGLLTKEYWEGRHGRWMRPLRIFLIVSALSLVLAPDAAGPLGLRIFATQGAGATRISIGQRQRVAQSPAAKAGVNVVPGGAEDGIAQVAVRLDQTYPEAALESFKAKSHKYYKIIQYLSLGLFAAFSLLLLRRSQPYFGAHLIWALHFYSFLYIVTGFVDTLHWNPMVGILLDMAYLTAAMRRLANGKWLAGFARAAVMMGVIALAEMLAISAASKLAWPPH